MRNEQICEMVVCPRCKSDLNDLRCFGCGLTFPRVGGIPVLINEENSIFRLSDFVEARDTTYRTDVPKWKRFIKKLIPSLTLNVKSQANFANLAAMIKDRGREQRVLIIGGAVEGEGMQLADLPEDLVLVETDVAFGDRTGIVCDAHDLPFRESSFDVVIAQAVLEHVVDPFRCVAEIHRVLKKDGLVYAESPFMAQVHLGRYDFFRFSHLAHRRLFREFAEIESGPTCGVGMALAWSYCYFLQSFFVREAWRQAAFGFGSLTGFWLKYFDYLLIDKPGTFDAALSYYFLGERSDLALSDQDLIACYRGSIR